MSPLETLTPEQHDAVTALGRPLCVTSGAGCGKTRVLVERYLHTLDQEPALRLEQLAAITFTEAAAAQMRTRIREACRQRMAEARDAGDARALARWRTRYWDVDVAPISTIHGFCGSLLRRWPIEAGVDPQFSVLDEAQAALLAEDVVDRTLEALLEADDEAARAALLHIELRELRDALRHLVQAERDALERTARPALAKSDDEILAAIEKDLAEARRAAVDEVLARPEVVEAARWLKKVDGPAGDKLAEACLAARDALEVLGGSPRPAQADAALATLKGIDLRAGSKTKWGSKEAVDEARAVLKAIRDPLKKVLRDLPPLDRDLERLHLEAARAVFALAEAALQAYDEAKRARSALDFEDLQLRARDLLQTSKSALAACRRTYRAILVDELQDTNRLQDEIVRLLTDGGDRPPVLFGVGDPKQSIYRFRGAEVAVFEETRGRLPAKDRKALTVSWRFHAGLADLVNAVFGHLMGQGYEPVEGRYGRAAPDGPDAELIHVVNPADPDGTFRADEGAAEEARALAARLRRLVEDQKRPVWDEKAKAARPVRYGDVAVLFRKTTRLHVYEEALEREGVPYLAVAGHGFYKQQEVLDVLALLRVLEDPGDDLSLAGVLRSPYFAVSDEGLVRLRQACEGALWDAVAAAGTVPRLGDGDRRGLTRAAAALPRWRGLKDRLGLGPLVEAVVFASGYAASAVGRFGGARAYANLRQLVDLARGFERSGPHALGDYVGYVADFMRSEMRQEQATVDVAGADTVRLMTIHKAKGLEFPVVVVPDLGGHTDGQPPVVRCHPTSGLAVRLRDDDGEKRSPAAVALGKAADRAADQAEAERVFYVAATRGKDHLILLSHSAQSRGHDGTWLDALSAALNLKEILAAGSEGEHEAAAGTGRLAVYLRPPEPETHRHDRRRVGPRDVFANGRVVWVTLAERAARAPEHAAARLQHVGPPGGTAPPTRVTATALNAWRRCPRLWTWQAVHHLGDPAARASDRPDGLSPLTFGTLVHRALEVCHSASPQAVTAAVETALRDAPPLREAERGPSRDRLREAVEAFFRTELGQAILAAEKVFREVPFVLELAEVEVAGVMDVLMRDASGDWHVVDYKTTAGPGDAAALAERSRLQLGLYALAAGRWLGEPVAAWWVAHLPSGQAVRQPVTPEGLGETEAEARRVLETVAAPPDGTGRVDCASCAYRVVCHKG